MAKKNESAPAGGMVADRLKARNAAQDRKDKTGLLDGGEERELAFIFSPEAGEEGAVLFGRLVSVEERVLNPKLGKPAKCLTFSPAIFVRPGEEPEPLRSASTVLSSSLALRITPETDMGRCFAIRYDGKEASDDQTRTAMRVYKVVEHPAVRLAKALTDVGAVVLSNALHASE